MRRWRRHGCHRARAAASQRGRRRAEAACDAARGAGAPLPFASCACPHLTPAAAQVAWGRCVAALGGAPVSFALHASPDAVAAATALRSAGALFAADGCEAPPLAGYAAVTWPPAANEEDEAGSPALRTALRLRRLRESEAQLVLAACALPAGTRAGLFAGDTTSVPDLPDLAGALTSRPPHLLLLSHENFNIAALMDRLEALLPGSGAAAAMAVRGSPGAAAEAESATAKGLAAPQQPLPPQLSFGDAPQPRPGFVGIALARQAPADGGRDTSAPPALPMTVPEFSALARAIFGSARAKSWAFSADVQAQLFLPAADVPGEGTARPAAALAAALAPSGATGRLPLFELEDVVMLPACREEVLIIEPRYRLMLRASLEASQKAFAASGGDHAAAARAGLFGVVSRGVGVVVALGGYRLNADGRAGGKAHIAVQGGRRFKVASRSAVSTPMGTFGLSIADVAWFDDAPPADSAEAAATAAAGAAAIEAVRSVLADAEAAAGAPLPRAAAVLAGLTAHADVAAGGDGNAEALSWEFAALLSAGAARARAWRDTTCTRSRLEEQIHYLGARRRDVVAEFQRHLQGPLASGK